jgi:Cof subfamily protein (haloacid dehalogenase superfamily)
LSGFPYRLAAIDLDATLLGPDKTISTANAAAVSRLRAAGVMIVLASGRFHQNMRPFHTALGLAEGAPIVSSNGAFVAPADLRTSWWEVLLPEVQTQEILRVGTDHGITQIWDDAAGLCAVRETPWVRLLEGRMHSTVRAVARFPETRPRKILWIAEPARIAALEQETRALWGDTLSITVTDPEYLEFMAAGVHKAAGLAVVCERLKIAPADVLALGDGDNDAQMLAWAGMGIALAHGSPSARAAARIVGPEAPLDRALAAAIDQLLQR